VLHYSQDKTDNKTIFWKLSFDQVKQTKVKVGVLFQRRVFESNIDIFTRILISFYPLEGSNQIVL